MRPVRAFMWSVLSGTLACSRASDELDSRRYEIIHGADDRLQAFEVPADVRARLLGASAALISEHHLTEDGEGALVLSAPSARDLLGLCDDERFAEEPAAAFCSGVLLGDDLVATAAHCFGANRELAEERCRSTRIAFGYAISTADAPVTLDAERTFACRKLVTLDGELAIVALDRAVFSPLSPLPLATRAVRSGDALIVASHGAGLPLKIELNAEVSAVDPASGALIVAMDTFAGSSGGGLYNQDLELVGLVESGDPDWEAVAGCTRAAHGDVPRESAVSADRVAKALLGADAQGSGSNDAPAAATSSGCSLTRDRTKTRWPLWAALLLAVVSRRSAAGRAAHRARCEPPRPCSRRRASRTRA